MGRGGNLEWVVLATVGTADTTGQMVLCLALLSAESAEMGMVHVQNDQPL